MEDRPPGPTLSQKTSAKKKLKDGFIHSTWGRPVQECGCEKERRRSDAVKVKMEVKMEMKKQMIDERSGLY